MFWLEHVAIHVPSVDQAEGYVHDGHHDSKFSSARCAKLAKVDVLTFQKCLPGVVEENGPHRPDDVNVILGVEEHELIPPKGIILRVYGTDGADVHASNLVFAAEKITEVIGKCCGGAVRPKPSH